VQLILFSGTRPQCCICGNPRQTMDHITVNRCPVTRFPAGLWSHMKLVKTLGACFMAGHTKQTIASAESLGPPPHAINRLRVRIPAALLSSATLGKLLTHTCASVTKQYNLAPANGRWCLAAGKVTVGLASHWPRVTDISGSPPTGTRPRRGRWTPPWSVVEHGWLYLLHAPIWSK